MTRNRFAFAAIVVGTLVIAGAAIAQPASNARRGSAAPCTQPTPECTEWVVLGGGPSRSLIYRSYPLGTRNDAITRVLVSIHGAGRDAHNYFKSTLGAAFLAGALENTLVISPRMASKIGRAHV